MANTTLKLRGDVDRFERLQHDLQGQKSAMTIPWTGTTVTLTTLLINAVRAIAPSVVAVVIMRA